VALRKRTSRRTTDAPVSSEEQVPGPTTNPATNLLVADVVMRTGSYVMREVVERRFLKRRFGKKTAREIVKNRSLGRKLASIVIAKIATRSVPGAAIVGTGILAKTLYERGKARRNAEAQGDAELLDNSNT